MSFHARWLPALASLAVAACERELPPVAPVATPHALVSDEESERLHDVCEARDVEILAREEVDAFARARGANFVEVIYQPDRCHVAAVLFSCPAGVRLPPSEVP